MRHQPYRLKTQEERFGEHRIRIECLEDLNQTIDALFTTIDSSGDTRLLEDLCPYFGVVWPSARALSGELLDLNEQLRDKRLLEVGCGLAIPSLLASKLGAQVTAVDFHPEVERFLIRNRELNEVPELRYVRVDWTRDDPSLGTFDWIVGSDVLYEKQQPAPLARMLKNRLEPGGRILIADPVRPYLQPFVDEMKRHGFRVESHVREAHDVPQPKEIFVLSFKLS